MTNNKVQEHYGEGDLTSVISNALAQAGIGDGPIKWSDIATLDQFHVRGFPATVDLAKGLSATTKDRVLDVGSGLGGPARYLAATAGCNVTGIDLSKPFIDAATMLSQRCGLTDLNEFVQGDALKMPFPDASFDHAWTQHVGMNIQDRAGLYSEIARVMKPGGKLGIYDVMAGPVEPLIFPVPWAGDPSISFLLSPDAMQSVLSSCGFKELSWTDTTELGLAALVDSTVTPFNLGILMGEGFGVKVKNLAWNLKEGRALLIEAVYERE
ncbi:MAG TPA: class I SAM-dependent methyltransferase [Fimbriimonadaceae bacterium]